MAIQNSQLTEKKIEIMKHLDRAKEILIIQAGFSNLFYLKP
jgi:hypothetical protein